MQHATLSALERQRQIYLQGVSGRKPRIPVEAEALRLAAEKRMRPAARAYICGGAGSERTIAANRSGFDQFHIVPRMLRNVEQVDLRTQVLGTAIPAPFLLAPIGVLEMAHSQADLAVSEAAARLGIPYIFSNQASTPMEACAKQMGEAPRWFQLYWSKSDALVASLVQRAEACGCSAIVVTLDTTMLGWRPRDLDQAYLPFLRGMGIAQYTSDPIFRQLMQNPPGEAPPRPRLTLETLHTAWQMARNYPGRGTLRKLRSGLPRKAVRTFVNIYTNPALDWDQLQFLREHTRLPIVLKGILHPDDAIRGADYGVDAIIISNHGGRQVDGALSTIEALPQIRRSVGNRLPLLLDSGIRTGADAFKAIALGATAVCIGRPYVYGLVLGGKKGVEATLLNMLADFELNMRLVGCRTVEEVRSAELFQYER